MDISLYRMIPPEAGSSAFVNSVSLMNVISHEIEDTVINNRLPVDFYAGFQRFSFFIRQFRRYQRLAAVCRRVYVWGIPDVDPPPMPGVEFIPVSPDMELAREWFLVVDTPQFYTALLTREETYGQELPKGARRFRGIWTYDPDLVGRAYLLISQILGQNFRPNLTRDYEQQNRHVVQISNRLVKRQDQIDRSLVRNQLLERGLAAGETPLIVLDAQRTVVSASATAAAVLRLDLDTLAGQPFDQLAGGAFTELDLSAPEAAAVSRMRDESGAPIAASAAPVPNKFGDAIGYLVTLHTSKSVQEQAVRQPGVVLPIAPMLQKYLGGIQQLLTMMPSLVARQDVQLRVVSQMQRIVGEMSSQVARLRLLQEIEAQADPIVEPTEITSLAQAVIVELQERAAEQGITLNLAPQGSLPAVPINSSQVRVALRELLENALRYAPAGSAVRIGISRQNGCVQIAVRDAGPGIDAATRERIFAPYLPGENSGLGLALTRAVAQAHRGQLSLESAPGQGSLFTLALPMQ
jgi:signal transduction histidine kinase